jgi:hypothetical protein
METGNKGQIIFNVIMMIVVLSVVGALIYVTIDNATRGPNLKSVDTQHLAKNAVTGQQIVDQSIDENKLADGAVGGSKLKAGAVTSAKIGDNHVNGNHISEDSVLSITKLTAPTIVSSTTITASGNVDVKGVLSVDGGIKSPAPTNINVTTDSAITTLKPGRIYYITNLDIAGSDKTITIPNPTDNSGTVIFIKSMNLAGNTHNLTFSTPAGTALFVKEVTNAGTHEPTSATSCTLTSPEHIDLTIHSDGTQYIVAGNYV